MTAGVYFTVFLLFLGPSSLTLGFALEPLLVFVSKEAGVGFVKTCCTVHVHISVMKETLFLLVSSLRFPRPVASSRQLA